MKQLGHPKRVHVVTTLTHTPAPHTHLYPCINDTRLWEKLKACIQSPQKCLNVILDASKGYINRTGTQLNSTVVWKIMKVILNHTPYVERGMAS